MIFLFCPNTDSGCSLELPHQDTSIKYPQCIFLTKMRKNIKCPCNSPFPYLKPGFPGFSIYRQANMIITVMFIVHSNKNIQAVPWETVSL